MFKRKKEIKKPLTKVGLFVIILSVSELLFFYLLGRFLTVNIPFVIFLFYLFCVISNVLIIILLNYSRKEVFVKKEVFIDSIVEDIKLFFLKIKELKRLIPSILSTLLTIITAIIINNIINYIIVY
ncbi:unnamed protein product, partial [marine sediment metagenome]